MLAIVAAAATLTAAPQPALAIRSAAPVTVRGSHFAADERVRVTLIAGGDYTRRRARTGDAGGFRVTFATPVDRCTGFVVRAVGVDGDHAQAVRRPMPECAAT